MAASRQEDAWLRVEEEHLSANKIRKHLACSPPLSAQDADGWRPREHAGFLLVEDDEELRTSFESTWSCYLLRAISSQVMSRRLSEVILYFGDT